MQRRGFCKNALITGAAISGSSLLNTANLLGAQNNQKELRPQDKPVAIHELNDEEKALIFKHYPELF